MVIITDDIKARIRRLKHESVLPSPPPLPKFPDLDSLPSISTTEKIRIIQDFIVSFEYNHSGKPFVFFSKSRGMSHIKAVSNELLQAALPIQCVEAVFLGCFLTAKIPSIDRIPLSFKSKMGSSIHRHIVLAIRFQNKWGAIGISRRENLMDKDFVFNSLFELVNEYRECYRSVYHRLTTIYLGLPFTRDFSTDFPIKWRALRLKISPYDANDIETELSKFTSDMNQMLDDYISEFSIFDFQNDGNNILQQHRNSISTIRSSRNREINNQRNILIKSSPCDTNSSYYNNRRSENSQEITSSTYQRKPSKPKEKLR